jgi:predicted HTH transcriptional regulator
MIEIFDDRIEITNPGSPLIEIDRFIDHPPRSRNENIAELMRLIGICEEGGTGVDRALINIGVYQLPAPKFETYDNSTRITMYAYKELKDMSTDDKLRACYQHAVLMHIQDQKMTNESLRDRLGINKSNYPAASAIIRAALDKNLIKESDRSKEYVPIWV